jgi:hypothetical protein
LQVKNDPTAREAARRFFALPPSFAMHDVVRSRRRAIVWLFSALAVVAWSGCDSDASDERERPAVRSFEVTFDVDDADFSEEASIASTAYDAPEITPRVMQNGLVMAYARVDNGFGERIWRALPYSYGVEFSPDTTGREPAVDYTVTLGFGYEIERVEVFYELSAYDDFVWDRLAERGPRRIRVVVFSEEAALRNQSLDVSDYEAVRRRFDLEG